MKNLFAISVAALLLLAACGGSTGTAGGPAGATVAVKLMDNAIVLDQSSVNAGTVIFKITNAGSVEHEFEVTKTNLAADQLPPDPAQPGRVKEDENVGEVEGIAVKATKDLSLKLEPGKYVLICNLPGHYATGMHVAFTVK